MRNVKRFIKPKRRSANLILLIFCLALTSIVVPAAASSAALPSGGSLSLIFASPDADSSTRMNISFISLYPTAEITYTTAADPEFTAAQSLRVWGVKTPRTFSDYSGEYYSYHVTLRFLEAQTDYLYKISDGHTSSAVFRFRTGTADGDFSFMWFTDVHSVNSSGTTLLANSIARKVTASLTPDFILSTGDMVMGGGNLAAWEAWNGSYMTGNYTFAMTPGNHEYYADAALSTKDDKARIGDAWFNVASFTPDNGASGVDASYWYIYGGVLFINLDSMAAYAEGEETDLATRQSFLSREQEWFKAVVAANSGLYRYLVVTQHYGFFDTDGKTPSEGRYGDWRKIFEEAGVDLALCGHNHVYYRTKPLAGNKNVSEYGAGTVYIALPEIEKRKPLELQDGSSGKTAIFEKYDTSQRDGMGLFTVTDENIVFTLYDYNGDAADSVTLPSRGRAMSQSKLAEFRRDNLALDYAATAEYYARAISVLAANLDAASEYKALADENAARSLEYGSKYADRAAFAKSLAQANLAAYTSSPPVTDVTSIGTSAETSNKTNDPNRGEGLNSTQVMFIILAVIAVSAGGAVFGVNLYKKNKRKGAAK